MKPIFCYLKTKNWPLKTVSCHFVLIFSCQVHSNNFKNNLDCDTPITLNMPETKKPEEKAKREEFRRYLGEFIRTFF